MAPSRSRSPHLSRSACALLALLALPAAAVAQTPTITAVMDAAAHTPNIPEGGMFVVKGTNLCGSGSVTGHVPYSSAPLNNAKITFTPAAGGAGIDAYMVSANASGKTAQLSAILPSTAPAGDYHVIVTHGGAVSPGFKVTVVVRKFGINTVSGSGGGRAVVQNQISQTHFDLNRFTTGTRDGNTFSPAHPHQIIVISGEGLGPITGPDNTLPGMTDMRKNLTIQVLINAVPITPDVYAGRAPSVPGGDEIALTLPANVPTGCLLPLQVSVDGQLSNSATISIASGTNKACTQPGFTTAQLAALDQGGKVNVGALAIAGGIDKHTTPSGVSDTLRVDSAGAVFVAVDPDGLSASVPAPFTPPANGTCQATRSTVHEPPIPTAPPFPHVLNPGKLLLNGPNVLNTPISIVTPLTAKTPGVTSLNGAVLRAGTYTIAGQGGKDIGPFQASIKISDPLVVTGGLPSTITRSHDLTIAWTGGGTEKVTITGSSSVVVSGTTAADLVFDAGTFLCLTTADKGSFIVPSSILEKLPASPPKKSGSITVSSNSVMTTFTAPLVAGGKLDYGYFDAGYENRANAAYK